MVESEKRADESEVGLTKAELGRDTVSLDLHGMRVEDAESSLDSFLNHEFMLGHRYLRIVHGKGSGRLQKMVEAYLPSNPLVDTWRRSSKGGEEGSVVYVVLAEKE